MTITIDESAVKRIKDLRKEQGKEALMLRVRVDGGGCSGFQYHLELTDEIGDKEQTFDDAVITDDISLGFLKDSVIKFEDGLIGSEFKIENPNAVAGCGCGTSFAV
ncbi:MAG: iron-sulfur cluster assembly accessory protein [Pseudomonadota bacterium]